MIITTPATSATVGGVMVITSSDPPVPASVSSVPASVDSIPEPLIPEPLIPGSRIESSCAKPPGKPILSIVAVMLLAVLAPRIPPVMLAAIPCCFLNFFCQHFSSTVSYM
ncbi:MAG: hypothetical protein HAW62_03445 [Endozoicomonadaceae bacterium]|nr:hypothetical protein [Endozoicomonadaceae bacterium]